MVITSRTNAHIVETKKLLLTKARRQTGLHLIEGDKLVSEALHSGANVRELFCAEGVSVSAPPETSVTLVSRAVLESLCESQTPQGVAAVVKTPDLTPPQTFPDGCIVLLDGVQDPGNVGSILRSADAFGAAGVLLSPACADPFSPKTLRAAMGSTYHIPVWQGELLSALSRLTQSGFTAICGHLRGAETLPKLKGNVAVVIGSEGKGVSDAVAEACVRYRLNMRGRAESLNASVAAALLLYIVSERMERGNGA